MKVVSRSHHAAFIPGPHGGPARRLEGGGGASLSVGGGMAGPVGSDGPSPLFQEHWLTGTLRGERVQSKPWP